MSHLTQMSIPLNQSTTVNLSRAFVSLYSAAFDEHKARVLSFVRDELMCDERAEAMHQDLTGLVVSSSGARAKSSSSSGLQSRASASLQRYMKEWSEGLRVIASIASTDLEVAYYLRDKFKGNPGEAGRKYLASSHETLKGAVAILFEVLYEEGCKVGDMSLLRNEDEDESEEINALVREQCNLLTETATLSLVHMLRIKHFERILTVEQWKQLAWRFLDSSSHMTPAFYATLIETFATTIQVYQMHPQFLAYQCLLVSNKASNSPALTQRIQTTFTMSLRRLRTHYDNICSRAMTVSSAKRGPERDPVREQTLAALKRQSEEAMPESVLPYVLYLLSYHPDFPTSASLENEGDQEKFNKMYSCLQMALSGLFESLASESDNISYLLKQVSTLVQKYTDRYDPENIGLGFIAKLMIKLLKSHIQTTDQVQSYPGEIVMPTKLFSRIVGTGDGELAHSEPVTSQDSLSQERIEKLFEDAVKHTRRGRKAGQGRGVMRMLPSSPEAKKATIRRSPAPRSAEKGPFKAKRARKSKADEDDDEGGSDDESAVHVHERDADDVPVGSSSRPVRSTRARVNYKEKGESEREVLAWEAQAARRQVEGLAEKKRSPGLQALTRKSEGAWADENVLASPRTSSTLSSTSGRRALVETGNIPKPAKTTPTKTTAVAVESEEEDDEAAEEEYMLKVVVAAAATSNKRTRKEPASVPAHADKKQAAVKRRIA